MRKICAVIALALGPALLAGCVVYQPVPAYYTTSTFERAWSAALGAVQDAGVQVTLSDANAGEIRGIRDGIDVAVTVSRQPDGRTRVQFDAKGPTDRDPGLPTRFSDAYDRRMGR